MLLTLKTFLGRRDGYTIDQTILIVAIIAILITLIIVTIGWQLINRTSGTKLGSQMRQVEDAAGQFYSAVRMWPHQAIITANVNPTNVARALANDLAAGDWEASVPQGELRNLLPGFPISGGAVTHNYGNGGTVKMYPGAVAAWGLSGTNQYMIVEFGDMPVSEAKEADRAIDGTEDPTQGRLVYQSAGTTCLPPTVGGDAPAMAAVGNASTVNVCYAANTVQ